MPARLLLACLLLLTPCLALLQGCAAKPAVVTPEPQRDSVAVAQQPIEPFRPSAPNEIVSERVKAERNRAVGDMVRTGLVTTVEQGPLGILRVGVGEKFHSHQAREYYFTQLAVVYHTWRADSRPLTVELWEGGRKIGEYADRTFLTGPGHTTPLDCPEAATTGLCSLATSVQQETPSDTSAAFSPQTSPGSMPAPAAARSGTSTNVRERSGFHFGLGLGGGAMDTPCHGCNFASETGFSGFLSVAGSVGEKTLVGVETTVWTGSQLGRTTRVYSVMAHATEYLSPTSGLFLRAGLGVVGYQQEADTGDDPSASGLGFSGRLGYELGAGSVVLVPYVGIVRTFGGADIKGNSQYAGWNVAISNVQVGLSIAAH
jgi:hypothetical protein